MTPAETIRSKGGLFSLPRHREGDRPAPFLPMTRKEMQTLGWDACDIIIVTGDAYVDHPSFGAALIGRLLESRGHRVGIIAQPDWKTADPFQVLGKPNLFFGVTAGNMDSMVNRYTADARLRSDDAYSPGGRGGRRPDRAAIVYAQRCRQAYPGVPIVLGGIEASLRRAVHYDYWSEKVRRSILLDAKAEILAYGNAERAVVAIARRLAAGEPVSALTDIPGTAFIRARTDAAQEADILRLPSYEEASTDPERFAVAARMLRDAAHLSPGRILLQGHGDRDLVILPPPKPLSAQALDAVYELPFARRPHPVYEKEGIPAYEMIRFSVTILRGCFGGCSFCSITEHEGRTIQSRSEDSILREIAAIRDRVPGFTGVISDLGGPTANMYRMNCKGGKARETCKRLSCLYPAICGNLETDHAPLIQLYRKARGVSGIKKVLIGSGIRHDLAVRDRQYMKELVTHHVGGRLKIAPEHVSKGPLQAMLKPGVGVFEKFRKLFDELSKEAGKEQFVIPYLIAAHPGTTDEDMLELALWLKANNLRVDQVQTFLPSPMTLATAMYHTKKDPLGDISRPLPGLFVPSGKRARRLHKAFLRYHDREQWDFLRTELRRMRRPDAIKEIMGRR